MAPTAKERDAISLAGYTDLDGRPGFKMALQEVDGTWYMYVAHFWHSGWSVLDVTDPTDPAPHLHRRAGEHPHVTGTGR
ncbi:hypothetical protein ACFQMM_14825 [Saliphagus sp. GCM10025308]